MTDSTQLAGTKRKAPQGKSRRQKKKYIPSAGDPTLEISPGMSGIFISGVKRKEHKSVNEMYDLCYEFVEKLYPEIIEAEASNECESVEDVEDAAAKEMEELKKSKKDNKLITPCSTGIDCLSFIKIDERVDTVKLVEAIFEELGSKKIKRTRNVYRIVPFQAICKAKLDKVVETATSLFEKVFKAPGGENLSFAIHLRMRNSEKFSQKKVIDTVAKLLPDNKVDLTNPDCTVLIEVFKSIAGISIVRNFSKYRKFNFQELYEQGFMKAKSEQQQEEKKDLSA